MATSSLRGERTVGGIFHLAALAHLAHLVWNLEPGVPTQELEYHSEYVGNKELKKFFVPTTRSGRTEQKGLTQTLTR